MRSSSELARRRARARLRIRVLRRLRLVIFVATIALLVFSVTSLGSSNLNSGTVEPAQAPVEQELSDPVVAERPTVVEGRSLAEAESTPALPAVRATAAPDPAVVDTPADPVPEPLPFTGIDTARLLMLLGATAVLLGMLVQASVQPVGKRPRRGHGRENGLHSA